MKKSSLEVFEDRTYPGVSDDNGSLSMMRSWG
jgi:hypothetical protein